MADDELDDIPIKPSKMPMIAAAVVALLLGAGGGFGAATFLGGGGDDEPAAAPDAASDDGGDGLADAGDVGDLGPDGLPIERAIVSLGKFTVNLRGGSGGRILRTEIEVETTTLHSPSLESDLAMYRDGVILLASDYTYADLDGLDGKLRLRDELLARLNTLAGEPVVKRVYFTEFVVQ